jgi:hypothetical protein
MSNLNFLPTETGGQKNLVVTPELILDYIRLKEAERRRSNVTKVCSKEEALRILGCSESTFYRLQRSKNSKIKKGAVNGTYITSSVYAQLESNSFSY